MSSDAQFKALGEESIYQSWFSLARQELQAPDGTTFKREVLHHPGAVSVVPLMDDNKTVLMVRQYRAAIGDYLVEIPAGKRDVDGEPAIETAHRELLEEVGMRAGRMDQIGEFYNSPGISDERHCLYLARDLTSDETNFQGIEEQHMSIVEVDITKTTELISSFTIRDAKSIVGLLLTRNWLESGR